MSEREPVGESGHQVLAAPMTHKQVLLVFSGLSLGVALAAVDQTVVATALPTIVGEFGDLKQMSWVVIAYLITFTASAPLYGKLSDLFGRKVMFQIAIGIFILGSLLAGVSQSMNQLIAFRAFQGVGAGGLMVTAMTIIGDILSPRARGRYLGYMGAVYAVSSIGGPLLGGFFVDHLSWRWVFFINLPIGLAALVVTGVVLNLPFRRRRRPIDYLGAGLLTSGVTALLLVTVWGGSEYAWTSATILGLSSVSLALIALFILQERRAPEPLLPLRLFRDRTFSITAAVAVIIGIGMFGAIVFVPLFLQVVLGVSATSSGLLLAPLVAGAVATSTISGHLITRTGRYKRYPVGGTFAIALALWLLSTMDSTTSLRAASLYMLLLGSGLGMAMQVLVIAVQNAVAPRDLGVATSAAAFFRSLGGSLGTALIGAIFASRLAVHLAELLPTGTNVESEDLIGSPALIVGLSQPVQDAVVEAFSRSLSTAFAAAVPILVAGFVLLLLLPELPLRDRPNIGHTLPAASWDRADEASGASAESRRSTLLEQPEPSSETAT